MKKILALVLALAMMATVVSAFAVEFSGAAKQSTEPTGTITITNLENGDVVQLYQVIGWFTEEKTEGTVKHTLAGWKVVNNFPAEDIDTWYAKNLTQDKVAEIAGALTGSTPVADTQTAAGGQITTKQLPIGMYLAIVKTSTDNIYNPMILSVNYNENDSSDAKDLTSDAKATYLNGGAAKKSGTDINKDTNTTSDAFTADELLNHGGGKEDGVWVGSVLPFEVVVDVPNYSDAYINPTFQIKDTMTSGLELDQNSIKVYWGDKNSSSELGSSYYTISGKTASGYTVDISSEYLHTVKAQPKVTIKYQAKVTTDAIYNVNRENNTVELKYSNNASDTTSFDTTSDETNHYTFSLDAKIKGEKHGRNNSSELIKTGKDDNGEPVYSWNNLDSDEWTKQNPLKGAKFVLKGKRNDVEFTSEYESDAEGKLNIKGLDEGTYTLQEISAPDGWIKDPNVHNIVISATYETVKNEHNKDIKKLVSYKVTIDGNDTEYTVVNNGPDEVVTSEVIKNETTNIVNTKGVELPSTGGIGTTIFYAVGGLMVLAAGIVLVSRRKAEEE